MNPLTTAQLDNNSVTVPIGRTVFTNVKKQNSKSVQAAQTGAEQQLPEHYFIEAPGYNGEQAFRDNNDRVFFGAPVDREGNLIAEASFDDGSGIFTIVRKNGRTVSASSFMRQKDFGIGPAGPRGDPGLDGTNGDEGKEGSEGVVGCAGVTGNDGRNGPTGDTGAEGAVGPAGSYGPIGPTGPRGDIGPAGNPGFEGKRGLCGASCPTTSRGPCGPVGQTMKTEVSLLPHPQNDELLWAAAEDCVCPVRPNEVYAEYIRKFVTFA